MWSNSASLSQLTKMTKRKELYDYLKHPGKSSAPLDAHCNCLVFLRPWRSKNQLACEYAGHYFHRIKGQKTGPFLAPHTTKTDGKFLATLYHTSFRQAEAIGAKEESKRLVWGHISTLPQRFSPSTSHLDLAHMNKVEIIFLPVQSNLDLGR